MTPARHRSTIGKHALTAAMMPAMMDDGQSMEGCTSHNYLISVGPEPHVCTVEEGRYIAAQIAARRKAKRGKKRCKS